MLSQNVIKGEKNPKQVGGGCLWSLPKAIAGWLQGPCLGSHPKFLQHLAWGEQSSVSLCATGRVSSPALSSFQQEEAVPCTDCAPKKLHQQTHLQRHPALSWVLSSLSKSQNKQHRNSNIPFIILLRFYLDKAPKEGSGSSPACICLLGKAGLGAWEWEAQPLKGFNQNKPILAAQRQGELSHLSGSYTGHTQGLTSPSPHVPKINITHSCR